MNDSLISQKNKQGLRNPWVAGLAVVLLVAVLANSKMIWSAFHVQVRLLDENFSVKDHKTLPTEAEQDAQRYVGGWKASLHSPQQLKNDSEEMDAAGRFILLESPSSLQIDLGDAEGKPVQGEKVTITAQWPSDSSQDFTSTMFETASGHYEGTLQFPRQGNWDLKVMANHNQASYAVEQRVFVLAVR